MSHKQQPLFFKRKGFTLMEIIIAIIISIMIGVYTMKTQAKNDFHAEVTKFLGTLNQVVQLGATGPLSYSSDDNGTNCSTTSDFEGITAARLNSCKGWNFEVDGIDTATTELDGVKNYLNGREFLRSHSTTTNGCHIYLNEDTVTTNHFLLFVDCSSVSYGGDNVRYLKYIEERVNASIQDLGTVYFVSVYRDSEAIKEKATGGGTDSDGMVEFELKGP